MTRRTLIPTMLDEAGSLQEHMTNFQVHQAGFFGDNPELLAAIADCATCLVNLIQALSAARERGD